jgi:hypothetical protein
MAHPPAQMFIVPQGSFYLQAKESSVGVHETWCDASIAAVPIDQNQFCLPHLPSLFHKLRQEDPIPHNLARVITVKIDFHGGQDKPPNCCE